jgi:hypothetical protein
VYFIWGIIRALCPAETYKKWILDIKIRVDEQFLKASGHKMPNCKTNNVNCKRKNGENKNFEM